MPKHGHTFNLLSWMSRLGWKGGEIPDILPIVQPVQVVGDASLLVPPLLPPTGLYGSAIAAVALQDPAVSIQSLADAGTLIRFFAPNVATSNSHRFAIRSTDHTWAASSVATEQQMGPSAMLSIVKYGTITAGNRLAEANNPGAALPARTPLDVADLLYIPPGQFFVWHNTSPDTIAYFYAVLQDLPALPGPE